MSISINFRIILILSKICNIRARAYVPRALSSFVDTVKILERSFWNCVQFLVQQLESGSRHFAPNGIPRIRTCADRVRACSLIVRVHSAISQHMKSLYFATV